MAIGLKPLNADRQINYIMNVKYEVVSIEINGQSKTIYFADTECFSSYFGWLRFLATIKEFGYKITAV
jgi:hypothetical protein